MKIFLKILIAIFIALVLWEVILELTVIKTPIFKNHPVLGEIYDRGICIWGKEGYSISFVNSLGMRNKEIKPKKIDEVRILLLGDSFTEAYHVNDNKIFATLLNKNLDNTLRNKYVSVINAGKGGNSPADYIYLSSYYKKYLKPDYVVIQLNAFDFDEALHNDQSSLDIKKSNDNFTIVKKKNYISANKLRQKYPHLTFFTQFAELRLGAEKFNTLSLFNKTEIQKNQSPSSTKENQCDDKYIEWVIKNLKQNYNNSILLFLPDVNGKKSNNYELSCTESLMFKYTKKYNFDYINMRKEFVDYRNKYHQPVNGFDNTEPGTGHLNEIGHKLVADKLTNYFKERINK